MDFGNKWGIGRRRDDSNRGGGTITDRSVCRDGTERGWVRNPIFAPMRLLGVRGGEPRPHNAPAASGKGTEGHRGW